MKSVIFLVLAVALVGATEMTTDSPTKGPMTTKGPVNKCIMSCFSATTNCYAECDKNSKDFDAQLACEAGCKKASKECSKACDNDSGMGPTDSPREPKPTGSPMEMSTDSPTTAKKTTTTTEAPTTKKVKKTTTTTTEAPTTKKKKKTTTTTTEAPTTKNKKKKKKTTTTTEAPTTEAAKCPAYRQCFCNPKTGVSVDTIDENGCPSCYCKRI